MKKLCNAAMLAMLGAVLTACGGGGGGGGGGNGLTFLINSDGASKIALNKSYEAILGVEELGYRIAKDLVVDVAIPPGASTSNCDPSPSQGGSGTISVNATYLDASPTTVQVGDRLEVTFNNCKFFAADSTRNGPVVVTITSVTDFPPTTAGARPWTLGVSVAFTNVDVTAGTTTSRGNGTLNVRVEAPTGATSYNATVTGDSFTVASGADTQTLTAFSITATEPEDGSLAGAPISIGGSGRLADTSAAMNGSISFSSAANFAGVLGSNFNAGQLVVNGASGTAARLQVQDTDFVLIDINNDGSIDGSPFPWSSFLAL